MLSNQTQQLLDVLAEQLQAVQLWSSVEPSHEALSSQAPFACDSMPFEMWLQFIFIPKMKQLIEKRLPLPTSMAITPMAEQVWSDMARYQNVIRVIQQLDDLLNVPR